VLTQAAGEHAASWARLRPC